MKLLKEEPQKEKKKCTFSSSMCQLCTFAFFIFSRRTYVVFIRLSLGKLLLLFYLLQVVKRTNNTLKNGVVDRSRVFWVVGSNPTIHNNKLFQTFPMSNLKSALPGIPRKRNRLDIDKSARISGRPAIIPPFQGGGSVVRLSLGKLLLVNLLQVVKRTNTSLIP